MTNLLLRPARRPHRRHHGFLILATIVILAVAGYGVVLNGGWPA
jgi:hypothetical protein